MNAANQPTIIATITAVLLSATLSLAHAADTTSDPFADHAACRSLGYTQVQNLKLAAKAREGATVFVQYVHVNRAIQQWSVEDALKRAESAAVSLCGVAMGFKPIDQEKFATALAANSR